MSELKSTAFERIAHKYIKHIKKRLVLDILEGKFEKVEQGEYTTEIICNGDRISMWTKHGSTCRIYGIGAIDKYNMINVSLSSSIGSIKKPASVRKKLFELSPREQKEKDKQIKMEINRLKKQIKGHINV